MDTPTTHPAPPYPTAPVEELLLHANYCLHGIKNWGKIPLDEQQMIVNDVVVAMLAKQADGTVSNEYEQYRYYLYRSVHNRMMRFFNETYHYQRNVIITLSSDVDDLNEYEHPYDTPEDALMLAHDQLYEQLMKYLTPKQMLVVTLLVKKELRDAIRLHIKVATMTQTMEGIRSKVRSGFKGCIQHNNTPESIQALVDDFYEKLPTYMVKVEQKRRCNRLWIAKQKRKAYKKAYRASHQEQIKAYRKAHLAEHRVYNARYRAKKKLQQKGL